MNSQKPKVRLLISATKGVVVAVHDDDVVQPLGQKLGDMSISRASNVEWEHTAWGGMWVATEIKTGKVLGAGQCRRKVLQDERAVLENKLADYVP